MQTISPKGKVVGPILPVYVLARPISAGAKILYAILCNYASAKDHCWPSQETLAKRVGCSISSVKNYLRELVGENLISVQREHSHSSIYYILRPIEFDAQLNLACEQSNIDCHESNSDYINNLNKQNKNKSHPLPPTGLETYKNSYRQKKASVGGVLPLAHDFLKLWEAYPKKEGKGLARMAFAKLQQENILPPLDVLLSAVKRFTATDVWQKENGRFIPQMSNWLRGERWADEGIIPSLHEKNTLEKQEKLRVAQEVFQVEEEEKRQQEHQKKEELRPQFNIFAAKFPPLANTAMAFGTWLYLHSEGIAPTANDVPEACALSIIAFMKEHQRQYKMALHKQNNASLYQMPISQAATPCLQKAV